MPDTTLPPIIPPGELFSAGVTFSHPQLPTLYVQYAPVEVDWSYNLITHETNTYAGQVIQVLGVNFDRFTISGRFGNEGNKDYTRGESWIHRNNAPTIANSSGITQMWTWFRTYMSIASQGVPRSSGISNAYDNYNQQPVTITYEGTYDDILIDDNKSEISWRVYPVNFPSFKISNENFAPEWRVECQVYEAPKPLSGQIMTEAIERLEYKPLYAPGSKWSDPNPHDPRDSQKEINKAALDAFEATLTAADFFMQELANFPPEQLEQMLIQGYSMPDIGQIPKHTRTDPEGNDPFQGGGLVPDVAGINSANAVFGGT